MWENTILVVVDTAAGSHQPALERAAWLAKQAGARVELFACEFDPDLESGRIAAAAREAVLGQRSRILEDLAAPLRQQGLAVSIDVVWDHPLDAAILKKAAAHDYWLVVKDTHHHNLAQRR
jgi:universal stress protein E